MYVCMYVKVFFCFPAEVAMWGAEARLGLFVSGEFVEGEAGTTQTNLWETETLLGAAGTQFTSSFSWIHISLWPFVYSSIFFRPLLPPPFVCPTGSSDIFKVISLPADGLLSHFPRHISIVVECLFPNLMAPSGVLLQISIVELEKSQRQQELLQLKSYSPCEGSPYRKNLELRSSTDMDSKLGLSSAPALNGVSPELSMNGTSSPRFDRANTKGELLSRYLPISPDHEIVPATPDARQRQQNSSYTLPDYTRFSPAKIALRRHLNQDPTANLRGPGLATHRLVGTEIKRLIFNNEPLFSRSPSCSLRQQAAK